MAETYEPYSNRKIRTNHATIVISITLVLFLLGLLGMIVLHARKLSDYVKENIGFSIIIKEGVKESSIFELKKRLPRSFRRSLARISSGSWGSTRCCPRSTSG
jgi:cell division transport system permease protein